MIHYFIPYSTSRDLGAAYNKCAALITNPDDWICFTDGDVMFLTPDYGHQLEEIILDNSGSGLITGICNRVGNPDQLHEGVFSEDANILYHRRLALELQRTKRLQVREVKNVISGFLMLIKKSTWDLIHGAPEGRGILSIDNHISQRVLNAGLKILVMEGVYMLHFYRLDTGRHDRSHLLNIRPEDNQNPIEQKPRVKKRSRFTA